MFFKESQLITTTLLCLLLPVILADDPYTSIEGYLYNKCKTNSQDPKAYDNLISNFNEYRNALEDFFAYLPSQKDKFCSSERGRLIKRTAILTRDVKPCLAAQENYLPAFIEETFKELVHFLCHNSGENINKFFSRQGEECRESIDADKTISLDYCFAKIFAPAQNFVKKEELCDAEDTARKCFTSVLNQKCPSNNNYRDLNEQFFSYIRKACRTSAAHHTSINTLLLLIASFITFASYF